MIAFAGLADLEQMAPLHARAFDRPWGASELERLLANPAAFALIAERAGFIMAWSASADAEILTLAVAPEARRQGLGAALVEAAAGAAAARGAESMFLEVAEDNAAAGRLYAKLGFDQHGVGGAPRNAPVLDPGGQKTCPNGRPRPGPFPDGDGGRAALEATQPQVVNGFGWHVNII